MKNVYVVKSAPKDIDEKHKELDTKNVYLLKSDEQTVNRYSNIVHDFIDDQDGLFLVVSQDKTFFQNFRNSFYKEMQVDQERIRLINSRRRAQEEIRVYREYQKKPFLFLESFLDGRSTLPFIEELKQEFKDMFIILLSNDADEKKVAQYLEAGGDNCITKPVSVNVLVEKIANTLEPSDEIGKMVREGKRRLRKVEFALAYGVARDILELKPGSPAGLMIMGDALKGLCKRSDALKMYRKASENAPMYLEPIKKIVSFYKEDGDQEMALEYLVKIDGLSPLHLGRKKEIGEIHFMRGNVEEAARYFVEAVTLMHQMKQPGCVEAAEDYADKIFQEEENTACPLYELCAKLARIYRTDLDWSVYNRLGMLLRRKMDWQGAVKAYAKAAEMAPENETILFNMGMAYVEGKDWGGAAQKFERAMRLAPNFYRDNLPAAYIMGQVFIRANRTGNASTVLGYVSSVDPDYKKVRSLLDSLKKRPL
jgi:tetratricopeptide (TPR) repeat protein